MKTWHLIVGLATLNYGLVLALGELSNGLARWSIGLHWEVLLVLFPALFLAPVPGAVLCLIFAFMIGVHAPVPFGMTLLSLFALWHIGIWMRSRLRREQKRHLAGLAACLQVLGILIWSLALAPAGVPTTAYWIRVAVEAGLSALLVAILAGWWCQWQFRLLEEFGWQPEST